MTLSIMNRCMIYIIVLLVCSCGSRKVDLQKRITDIEHNLSVKIKELEIERNKLRVYESSRVVKADSVVEKNGKRTIYNARSEEMLTEKEESSENEKSKEGQSKVSASVNSVEIDKKIDKKQFDWWGVGVSIVVIVLLLCLLSGYWKKLF